MRHPFIIGEKTYLRGLERSDLEGDYFDWLNDDGRYYDSLHSGITEKDFLEKP